MYYPEFDSVEIEIPNPYGLPPDPVIEDKNENENENIYFNKVIKQMYKSHKNEFLFPAPINNSKSMEISKLPIEPSHKSHFKKVSTRHKSDPTKPSEKKKNSSKKSKKAKTSNKKIQVNTNKRN